MCARGLARRLCTQSGFVSAPAFEPMMIILPSMVRYASGASRGWPDLAPVVVSNSRVRAFERAADLAAVGAELVDDALVERLHGLGVRYFGHSVSFSTGIVVRPRIRGPR